MQYTHAYQIPRSDTRNRCGKCLEVLKTPVRYRASLLRYPDICPSCKRTCKRKLARLRLV